MIILQILYDYIALSPLEVEIDENISANWNMRPGFDKFAGLCLAGGHFLCFSTIIDQSLIQESFRFVCNRGKAWPPHRSGHWICAPLPAPRTDCSAEDWTLSNSAKRHARADCDHTPPTQHRGRMHPPLSPHTQKYTHAMPPFWTHHPAITGSLLAGLHNQSKLSGSRSAPRLHLYLRNKS